MARDDDRQDERSGGGGGEAEPEERTDAWMTTYADMVTLLMTFFVLMFAISNVDSQKAMLVFAGLSRDGLTAEQFMEIQLQFDPSDIYEDDHFAWMEDDGDDDPDSDDDPGDEFGNEELEALYALIGGYIDDAGIGEQIGLQYDGEFLLLTLRSDIWFDTGSAVVRPEMREIGVVLAQLLVATHNEERPFEIIVAGHTDNVPISTVRYPSNWHVSADRALNFLEILIVESQLDPTFFYARGCGEYRPIATNDTPEGRQMNRRVEVMITLPREDQRLDPYAELMD